MTTVVRWQGVCSTCAWFTAPAVDEAAVTVEVLAHRDLGHLAVVRPLDPEPAA